MEQWCLYVLFNQRFKNRKADKNKDGEVTIDELSAYVSTAVYDLTDGNQRPNARQENQFNNFLRLISTSAGNTSSPSNNELTLILPTFIDETRDILTSQTYLNA